MGQGLPISCLKYTAMWPRRRPREKGGRSLAPWPQARPAARWDVPPRRDTELGPPIVGTFPHRWEKVGMGLGSPRTATKGERLCLKTPCQAPRRGVQRGFASKLPVRPPGGECRGAKPLCRGRGGAPRRRLHHPLPGRKGDGGMVETVVGHRRCSIGAEVLTQTGGACAWRAVEKRPLKRALSTQAWGRRSRRRSGAVCVPSGALRGGLSRPWSGRTGGPCAP